MASEVRAESLPLKALLRVGGWLDGGRPLAALPRGGGVAVLVVLFAGPVLATALLVQEAGPLFWSVFILDLVALFLFALLTWQRPALLVGIVVLWFALQRLAVALLAPHVSADVVRWLLTYKEGFYLILLAAGAVGVFLRYRRRRVLPPLLLADVLAIALLGLLVVELAASPAPFSPRLTYLRRLAAPLLFYLGGRLLAARGDQFRQGLGLLLGIALAVAGFGLVERFFLSPDFWQDQVDAAAFYARQVEAGLLPENWGRLFRGLPDGIFIALPLEVPVRRLVSTYLEPTTLASFLGLALVLLLLVPGLNNSRRAGVGLLAVLLALVIGVSLSRGGILAVLAALALFSLIRFRSLWHLRFLWAAPVAAILGLALFLTTWSFSATPDLRDGLQELLARRAVSGLPAMEAPAVAGTTVPPAPASDSGSLPEIEVHPPGSTAEGAGIHLEGLRAGLEEMWEKPLGLGLGAAGVWSEAPEVGGESTVGTVAAQLGIMGLALWLAFSLTVIGSLIYASLCYGQAGQTFWSDVTLALAAAFFGLFLAAWFTESAGGLLGNAFYFLFAGWALAQAAPASGRWQFRWLPEPAAGKEP